MPPDIRSVASKACGGIIYENTMSCVVCVAPVSGCAIRPVNSGLLTTVASDGSTHVPSDCIHGSPTRHINPTRQHVSDPDDPPAFNQTRGHGFILFPSS
ncbi:MAG: hypothetical protein CVV33_03310 [Methanomicrobiales archaeon HGW-Methanomicrobiales-4]|nr:MAG: hypothetical protein CVV33_03310 [Methanomicrobiales archaeon HGW-Methanomicrobiales-4]